VVAFWRGGRRASPRPGQFRSIRDSERVAEAGVEPPVGSVGDSYDNALAETIIGLFKTEVIHHRGPWRHLEAVEYATLEWVDGFNHRRLPAPIGNVPPAELELAYHRRQSESALAARLKHRRLGKTRGGSPGSHSTRPPEWQAREYPRDQPAASRKHPVVQIQRLQM